MTKPTPNAIKLVRERAYAQAPSRAVAAADIKDSFDLQAWKNLKSYNPKVCMERRVHYTTQQSAYERIAVGYIGKRTTTKDKPSDRARRRSQAKIDAIVEELSRLV